MPPGQFLSCAENLALVEIDRPAGLCDFRLQNDAASIPETEYADGIFPVFVLLFRNNRRIAMMVI